MASFLTQEPCSFARHQIIPFSTPTGTWSPSMGRTEFFHSQTTWISKSLSVNKARAVYSDPKTTLCQWVRQKPGRSVLPALSLWETCCSVFRPEPCPSSFRVSDSGTWLIHLQNSAIGPSSRKKLINKQQNNIHRIGSVKGRIFQTTAEDTSLPAWGCPAAKDVISSQQCSWHSPAALALPYHFSCCGFLLNFMMMYKQHESK